MYLDTCAKTRIDQFDVHSDVQTARLRVNKRIADARICECRNRKRCNKAVVN